MKQTWVSFFSRLAEAIMRWQEGGPLDKAVQSTVRQFPQINDLRDYLLDWINDPRVADELKHMLQEGAGPDIELLTRSLLDHRLCMADDSVIDSEKIVVAFLNALRLKILEAQMMVMGQP